MSYGATLTMEAPGKSASAALALAVHVLLAGFLLYGINWQTRLAPEAVEVELVNALPAAAAPVVMPPAPTPLPEPKAEPRPEPKVEAKPPLKADIEIKEKPKPKPVAKPPEATKPPADSFKKQLEQDLVKATQRKTADDAAAKELADLSNKQAAQTAAAHSKAMADYEARIRGKIKGNIVLPTELKGNPIAVFVVTQLPDGEILETRLASSSGISAYDEAIERAIRKSSPLPKPTDPSLFQRDLKLTFCPDEQRGCR